MESELASPEYARKVPWGEPLSRNRPRFPCAAAEDRRT